MTKQKLIYWFPVYVIAAVFGSLSVGTNSGAVVIPAVICSFVAAATSLFVKKALLSKGLLIAGNTIVTLLSGLFLISLVMVFSPESKQEKLDRTYRRAVMAAKVDLKFIVADLELILITAKANNCAVDPCFEVCSLIQTNR